MDAHGEKRPRDEAPVCLTCKKPDGPFPALHPDCHHAYCAKCVLHAEAKWCEFCRKDWNYTYRSFNTDDGHVFVVRCVAGNHLWTDKVIVYYANVNTLLTGDGHVAHLQHKHPEFRAWLVAHGLRRDKTARQRVAKYLERFGPRARAEEAEGGWVVLGPAGPTRHAAYVTDAGAERVYISGEQIMPYNTESTSRRGLLAIIRAIENHEAQ